MGLFKRGTTNPISLTGAAILVICLFLPFHRLACNREPSSIYDTVFLGVENMGDFLELVKTGLASVLAPNVFAAYLLLVSFLLAVLKSEKADRVVSAANFVVSIIMFSAFAWFYLSDQILSRPPTLPLIPKLVYFAGLAAPFVLYVAKVSREKNALERFYSLQVFGGAASLVFYLSLIYFFVVYPRMTDGGETPGLAEAFCYGYWFSCLASFMIMTRALKGVRERFGE